MKRLLSMFGDFVFCASTHALRENWRDPLIWTIKPSMRLMNAALGYVTIQPSNMIVSNADPRF